MKLHQAPARAEGDWSSNCPTLALFDHLVGERQGLIKRQAVLPALASLKAVREVVRRDPGARPLVGFADPVFDPAERARALAERRAAQTRVAVTRGYGEFWQGAGIDRAKLPRYLPSLVDTADELKAVAGKLRAAAGDVHLGSDASETVVKRTALNDYRVVYFATHGFVAGMSRWRTVARAHPAKDRA
jgi:hypothetical protein